MSNGFFSPYRKNKRKREKMGILKNKRKYRLIDKLIVDIEAASKQKAEEYLDNFLDINLDGAGFCSTSIEEINPQ